jgi:NADH pyrophosphatase NudC (nudix superfamily)
MDVERNKREPLQAGYVEPKEIENCLSRDDIEEAKFKISKQKFV